MKFEEDRGLATAKAEEDQVELRFDLMRLDRRTGDVTAELTAVFVNGSTELLHRTRLSLLSTRSLTEVARHLQQRHPGPNWPELLEEASYKVVDSQRRGRPAILLRDAIEPPAQGWIVEPLLQADEPTVLFGDGGSGKSQLALALAASIHTGRNLAGFEVTRTMRTAFLDWEWTDWRHRRRLEALWGSGELPDLAYVPCQAEGPLSQQVDRVRRELRKHQAEFVVIDSVALGCDGPPEEAQSALNFFQALARLEVTSLLVAHVNRSGDIDKPFGSAFWHNNARATWYVKRVQEVEGTTLDLALLHKKGNDGRLEAPIGLRIDFGARGTHSITAPRTAIRRVNLREVPELADQVPLKDRIADLLAGRTPLKIHEIGELLSAKQDTVDRTLRRYEGKLFERDLTEPDRVSRWKRTGAPDTTGQLSAGLPATEADTLVRPPLGDASVRPTEPRPDEGIQNLLGLSGPSHRE